jgi:hypothetical protein
MIELFTIDLISATEGQLGYLDIIKHQHLYLVRKHIYYY